MNIRFSILIAALILWSAPLPGQQVSLKFIKKIGSDWEINKWAWMSYVAFSPDGKQVASDGAAAPDDTSGELTFWSFPEGRLTRKIAARQFVLSSDWKYYSTENGVFETETGKQILEEANDSHIGTVFSPDSRYVAEFPLRKAAALNGIRVVELAGGEQVSAFGKRNPFSIAISPDEVTLAAGYWDVVTLWNLLTGERVAVLDGFGSYFESLAFSADGRLLSAGTDVGTLQIWDVRRRARLQSINPAGGYSHVSTPAFTPDGGMVAVGIYGTGTVFLIDVATGKTLDQKKISDLGCGSVAFSPDGRFLIAPSTGGLVRWPYETGGSIRVFEVVHK